MNPGQQPATQSSGTKFGQFLVDQRPVYDNRVKRSKAGVYPRKKRKKDRFL